MIFSVSLIKMLRDDDILLIGSLCKEQMRGVDKHLLLFNYISWIKKKCQQINQSFSLGEFLKKNFLMVK